MTEKRRTSYVVDTNVIIDYVDIIPDAEGGVPDPENPSIDFDGTRLVIPSAVIRELAGFKKEHSERGKAAREALRRIHRLFNVKCRTMREIYELKNEAEVSVGSKHFALLPVHKNFVKSLPFAPTRDDMDGQIILTGLTVACIEAGIAIDGTGDPEAILDLAADEVVIITNDVELSERAWERGIMTARYCHKYPDDYSGVRESVVGTDLFNEFVNSPDGIDRELWEMFVQDERELVANEFIVMRTSDVDGYPRNYDPYDDPYYSFIGRYDKASDYIVHLKQLRDFPIAPKSIGQAIYAEALANDAFDLVICTGPAGSGKTFMASIYGYMACKKGWYLGATVVPCEVNKSYGALPGKLSDKLDPDVQPIKNALRNYLLENDKEFERGLSNLRKFGFEKNGSGNSGGANSKRRNTIDDEEETSRKKQSLKVRVDNKVDQIFENWFTVVPVDNARGRDFAYEFVEYDEFQDQNAGRADMLIKRIGKYGKVVITGDIRQIHAPYVDVWNNGIVYVGSLLYDCERVARVNLTQEDVWRHPLVKEIARRQEKRRPASSGANHAEATPLPVDIIV